MEIMESKPIMRQLENKTVLVTGGAVRIGKAICLAAAKAGANVILHFARSAKQAAETKDEVETFGVACRTIQYDFENVIGVQTFAQQVGKNVLSITW